MTQTRLSKAACFTDIHWGKKNNSELHNQDCLRFIDWFCEEVKKEDDIDHIIFLGDWFEQRSAINGLTLDYAYRGATKLQSLNLPVYFIVGNHDLYYRTSREVYSTNFFTSLDFKLIDKPTVCEEIGLKGTLLSPYLFENEYGELAKFFDIPVWFGHFEFKGFVLTGDTVKLEHGPDPVNFSTPRRIFSGHFHKRQSMKNISYIGNAFPVDFSDANDSKRGMMIYEHGLDDVWYIDWEDCPTYIRTKVSDLVKNVKNILKPDATVNCIVDTDITHEQSIKLKEQLTKKYNLRSLALQENPDILTALEDTEIDDQEIDQLDTVDAQVKSMLSTIEAESIDNDKLIKLYEELNVST